MLYKIQTELLPHLKIIGRSNENPPWRHEGRALFFQQIVLVVAGECQYTLEGESCRATPGTLLYTPENCFYKLSTRTHCEYFFACFQCEHRPSIQEEWAAYVQKYTRQVDERSGGSDFHVPTIGEKAIWLPTAATPAKASWNTMLSLFTRCQELYRSPRVTDRLLLDALFYELLLTAGQSVMEDSGDEQYSLSVQRAMQYISLHYTERMTPDSLAVLLDLSKEHLCNQFQKELHCTVSEYVNRVKLTHGAELLLNSSMNVSQISEYLGFSSVYYFSRCFKKQFGVSPTRYVQTMT